MASAAAATPVVHRTVVPLRNTTCETLPMKHRSTCGDIDITQAQCVEAGCCWDDTVAANNCYFGGGPKVNITTVHVVQACHLDVGFANSSVNIVNLYFDTHFPNAIRWAAELAANGSYPLGLKFMTQSYLISLFMNCPPGMGLHCPNATYKAEFTKAVKDGVITWHAFPFNAELELMSANEILESIQLTHSLDDYFGLRHKFTMSQRDVPGTSRSIIPLLLQQNVTALSVGVNGASTPPNVPAAFVWQDPVSAKSLLAMWHPHGYGGINTYEAVIVPGLDHALVFEWNGDNAGPPPPSDVYLTYRILQGEFPGAKIMWSTFDDFVPHLATVADQLPVVSTEIGDTWIHGVMSDPIKVQQMRAINRAADRCVAEQRCSLSDPVYANFSRLFIKSSEHTWGKDVKTWLNDSTHWSNAQLVDNWVSNPHFVDIQQSWIEQRNWGVNYPIQALGSHSLAADIAAEFASATQFSVPNPEKSGFKQLPVTAGPVMLGDFEIGFDTTTCSVNRLVNKVSGNAWVDQANPLLKLEYRTYNETDFVNFLEQYIDVIPPPWWAYKDFGKPNVSEADPIDETSVPTMASAWLLQHADISTVLLECYFEPERVEAAGAPAVTWMQLDIGHGGAMNVSVQVFNKTATRLPEAMFLRFGVSVDPMSTVGTNGKVTGWQMDKVGEPVSPLNVQTGGAMHMHSVASGISYTGASGQSLTIDTMDVPVVNWGPATAFPTPTTTQPSLAEGPAFVLWDNLWGTNYVMWWPFIGGEQDSIQYRFQLHFD